MENINFTLMSGSGNNFIVIDNMDGKYSNINFQSMAKKLCARGVAIGADGLMVIESCDTADFKWQFYNEDGSVADMCGNGARCAARFAYLGGHVGKSMTFLTGAGLIRGEIKDTPNVKIQLTTPHGLEMDKLITTSAGVLEYSFINTGVPHVVIFIDDIENYNVNKIGAEIRYNKAIFPVGTNVNFIKVIDNNTVRVRTYERGVEGETLACGTGSVASAIICMEKQMAKSPVTIKTSSGGILKVYREEKELFLEGEARVIMTGEINKEAVEY